MLYESIALSWGKEGLRPHTLWALIPGHILQYCRPMTLTYVAERRPPANTMTPLSVAITRKMKHRWWRVTLIKLFYDAIVMRYRISENACRSDSELRRLSDTTAWLPRMAPLEFLVNTKVKFVLMVNVILAGGSPFFFWICCEYFCNEVSLLVSSESWAL